MKAENWRIIPGSRYGEGVYETICKWCGSDLRKYWHKMSCYRKSKAPPRLVRSSGRLFAVNPESSRFFQKVPDYSGSFPKENF